MKLSRWNPWEHKGGATEAGISPSSRSYGTLSAGRSSFWNNGCLFVHNVLRFESCSVVFLYPLSWLTHFDCCWGISSERGRSEIFCGHFCILFAAYNKTKAPSPLMFLLDNFQNMKKWIVCMWLERDKWDFLGGSYVVFLFAASNETKAPFPVNL